MQWMQKLLFKSSVTLGMNCFLIPTICRLLTWVRMVNNSYLDSHYFQAIYTSVSLSATDIYWFRFIHSKLYLVPFVVRKTLCRLEHFIASTLLLLLLMCLPLVFSPPLILATKQRKSRIWSHIHPILDLLSRTNQSFPEQKFLSKNYPPLLQALF